MVYLRSVRYSFLYVNRGNSQESREEDGRDDQPVISDAHLHIEQQVTYEAICIMNGVCKFKFL